MADFVAADFVAVENKATYMRMTCGRPRQLQGLEPVRLFLRDVHAPTVARRPSLWEYHTEWLGEIRDDFLPPIAGIEMNCDPALQIQSTSDTRWLDLDALADFNRSPNAAVKPLLFVDVGLLVAESTSYDIAGDNGWTFIDRTGDPTPQGPATSPTFDICLRERGDPAKFRSIVRQIAAAWSVRPGVKRLRMNLFEPPNMEMAVKAPAPPHPVERQYQALIHIQVEDEGAIGGLLSAGDGIAYSSFLSALHVYPVNEVYTWNYHGRPTVAGLRGYPAYKLIKAFDAGHVNDVGLLEWMYGHVVRGGPVG